jgi:hypothetical protein
MHPTWKAFRLAGIYFIAAATTTHALHADAGSKEFAVNDPAYKQECGSCHVAYPPALLSAPSWRAVMGGLDRHFGTDASLDPAPRAAILAFLEKNAGTRDTSAGGKPLLRISETAWFRKEHGKEVSPAKLKLPEVKSIANCGACHTGAERGSYAERDLRVPGGRTK